MSAPSFATALSIDRLLAGHAPSAVEVESAILAMLDGDATDAQIAGWLVALRAHGETPDALVGGARALLARAMRLPALARAVDTCGTGGDGHGSLNVSTLAALALAATGVPVSKHGNRSISSRTGSADLVAALGIDLEAPLPTITRGFDELGLAFLYAPRFHPALRRVASVRRELGTRTLFNLLGPLCNPAEAKVRVVGVFSPLWLWPMARALAALGVERAVVLCGEGNLDEPSPQGQTEAVLVEGDRLSTATYLPSDFGLQPAPLEELRGGEVEENRRLGLQLLGGAPEPRGARNAIVMTAALGLQLWGGGSLAEAAARIRETLDEGRALSLLERWRALHLADAEKQA